MTSLAFILKKTLSRFFFPVPLVIELLLGGWLLRRLTKRKRLGTALMASGVVLLLLAGYPLVGDWLLQPLEGAYLPLTADDTLRQLSTQTDIVVLGQELVPGRNLPAPSRVNGTFLGRFLEGVRLQRKLAGSRIILSMGSGNAPEDEDRFIAEMQTLVGLDPGVIVRMSNVRDTADEVRQARMLVRRPRVVLVTSASHMPRAMVLARHAGLDPLAAPCDYWGRQSRNPHPPFWTPEVLFPEARGYQETERAIYEYLGLAWATVASKAW